MEENLENTSINIQPGSGSDLVSPKNKVKVPISGKKKKLVFGLLSLAVLVFIAFNWQGTVNLLGKLRILDLLRKVGVLQPSIPGYFAALKDQNLVYDYNNDGSVTG